MNTNYNAAPSVADLTRMLKSVRINTPGPRTKFTQGPAPGVFGQNVTCAEQGIGNPIEYEDGEIVYVIIAHGGFNGKIISRKRENFENIRFGVVVGEGASLFSRYGESMPAAAQRHIEGIVNGNIRVFQRYPWSKKPVTEKSKAIFPNLVFSEGGTPNNKSFVATICRYNPSRKPQASCSNGAAAIPVANVRPMPQNFNTFYDPPMAEAVGPEAAARMSSTAAAAAVSGTVQFFNLTLAGFDGSLIPFNKEHTYPVGEQNKTCNRQANNIIYLETLLKRITMDVNKINGYGSSPQITRINIVFATCLANLPSDIFSLWTGTDDSVSIVTGGARKKNRKKRKQRRYIRKKIKTRKKRKQRKKRKKRKTYKKRKTNKKRKTTKTKK